VRQRLCEVRPQTLGQAARIPGLTPAAVSLLLVHLKKRDHAVNPSRSPSAAARLDGRAKLLTGLRGRHRG
jgi:hypothetical protein